MMNTNLLKKIMTNGKLLETTRSTEVQKEYLDYCYNSRFYRIVKHMGEVTEIIRIKKDYLSEWAMWRLSIKD
jgi:hypothetical protein